MRMTSAKMADRTFATLRHTGPASLLPTSMPTTAFNANPYEGERVTFRHNPECPFCPDMPHSIGERIFTDERARELDTTGPARARSCDDLGRRGS